MKEVISFFEYFRLRDLMARDQRNHEVHVKHLMK